jgi:SAM-dependent methyltransferase
MRPPDALTGWDDLDNAERYDHFTATFPFYTDTSRDLVARANLERAEVVVDLCGGTGATAQVILDALPPPGRVICVDNAHAMHAVGRRRRIDPRITWVLSRAEDVAAAVAGPVDAVLCNAAIWKTDTTATFAAVRQLLRPAGRFVFNVGGGFAGLDRATDRATSGTSSLNDLITAVAVRDYDYHPEPTPAGPVLTAEVLAEQLHAAGFTRSAMEVVTHHGTLEEKRAWLSMPIFARPAGPHFTHEQRMRILDVAYRQVDPTRPTTTRWLVVTAEA